MSRIPAHPCPRCGYPIDTATAASYPTSDGETEPVKPRSGDLTVCLWCGAPMEFRESGDPRWLTLDELNALPREARWKLAAAWAAVLTYRPARVRWVETRADA